jgi:c-di-GMP-binding flagellar brake protein YcgR
MSDQPPKPATKEKRRHRRYRISIGVTIRTSNGGSAAMQGLLQEISEGGMSAFVGAGDLKLDDAVELDLSLPSGRMYLRAIIRNQSGRHFRFEFVDLTPEQTEQIKESHKKMQPFINKVRQARPK